MTGQPAPGLLHRRHVAMTLIGGVIGASLFVGFSASIATAGPGVGLSCLLGGLIVPAERATLARPRGRRRGGGRDRGERRSGLPLETRSLSNDRGAGPGFLPAGSKYPAGVRRF
ncbi:hypothetical protein [Gluconacetobacter takamatsuzukensis]|uniref:Uncharacterized protein n=1 Tax=Gluconacetobacter takamatsuzukensis TaxID=1286190 RepID=A0A7W4KEG8_9PROT|nr:hypothetical protein [Gluconacetobacter takamatsuzukensis]MBB2205350.1 hypothetical protein [Gluconacetobacter takamatsuzukensis]